jgi:hypothetical protein
MIFLEKAITPMHELLLQIRTAFRSNMPPTREELESWYINSKAVSKALDDRLFIVMSAQDKGWTFAKELDFYKSGRQIDRDV